MKPALTVVTRHGCHLCEDMLAQLRQLQQEQGFELQLRDVDSEPALFQAYHDKVPVLLGEVGEICRYYLDPVALHRYFDGI